jgi:hypothetical protein
MRAPQDEVLASGVTPNPHGEEVRSTVSNHEARIVAIRSLTIESEMIVIASARYGGLGSRTALTLPLFPPPKRLDSMARRIAPVSGLI